MAELEIDPTSGKARVIDAASDDLAASAGPTRNNRNRVLTALVERRALSTMRKDKDGVLAAFGAKSPVDLALMGHGLSLSDQFWYRAPGSTERWEDVNFFDNGWDPGFGAAILLGDYARLAACSPDAPEATTPGHAVKAWERDDDGIYLVKAADYPDGSFGFPFNGVSLSDLCENPLLVELFCAHRFSFLKSSWDWSWYDAQTLDGFEDAIMEAFASCRGLPPVFAELIARLFVAQHDYVNRVASGE